MLPPPGSMLPLSPHILSAKSGWGSQGCHLVTRPQQGCRQSLVVCDGDSLHWELPEGGACVLYIGTNQTGSGKL